MRMKLISISAIYAIALLGMATSASAQDKCKSVYKQYPITKSCGSSQECLQKNMENRKARVAAGCKATKNS